MSNAERDLPPGGIDGLGGSSGHEPTVPERTLFCAAQGVHHVLTILTHQGPGNWPDEGATEDCALVRHLIAFSDDHKAGAHIGKSATGLDAAADQGAGRKRNRTQRVSRRSNHPVELLELRTYRRNARRGYRDRTKLV